MKSMKQFGEQLVGYEGIAQITFEEPNTKIESSGYFEAAQFPSGRTAISFVPTDPIRPTANPLRVDADAEISFHGSAMDGWKIKLSGQTIFSRLSWLFAPLSRQPVAIDFGAQYIEAIGKGARDDGYSSMQFVVSNFLWHERSKEEPEPITLKVQGFEVEISAIEDYLGIAQRLANTHGIEPTARVRIQAPPCQRMRMQSFRDFMDDLVYIFRLVSGNLVDWYYAEAVDEQTKKSVERVHKYAVTGPYSNTIRFRPLRKGYQSSVPKLDIGKLADAFLSDAMQILHRTALKPLINQFTNACDESLYLESRGLLASTLTELIAAKNAYACGSSEIIPKGKFEAEILPVAVEAIENTGLPTEVKCQMQNHLQGGYRRSFRSKYGLLNSSYQMDLSSSEINRIVATRNTLVHEGNYGPSLDMERWSDDYQFMTWTNFIALCRLAGYSDELPKFAEGIRLEV